MPVTITLATALPLMLPNIELATIAVLAGPPVKRPVSRSARSMNVFPAPVTESSAPKMTNMAMKVADIPVTPP